MKRKVLISVLAIALVLTLCIGIFAACDPKKAEYTVTYSLGEFEGTGTAPAAQKVEEGSKTTLPTVEATWEGHTFAGWKAGADGELLQPGTEVEVKADITYTAQWKENGEPELPKVTIYYTLGTELKSVVKSVMTTEEAGKYQLNEPSGYLPDDEWGDFIAQLGKAEKYGYYYYDATATDHKGAAFNYNEFEAEADFSIIIIKESIGTLATSIDSSWYGVYAGQSSFGQPYRLTISNDQGGKIELDDSVQGAIGYILGENIYNTTDGKLMLAKYDEWSESYVYYYFTKNTDGTITLESDGATVQLTKAQEIKVTVYYPIDGNGTLHTIEIKAYKIGETCSLDDSPERPIEEDWDAFEAQGGYDKEMHYYFYNNQQKGEEFDWREFEADGDISIIIEFAKFADKIESIDAKFNGTFRGTSECWEDTFVLTISSADGTASLQYANEENSVFNFEASIEDGSILMKDGKLVLAKGNKLYPSYFYLTEKDGAYTFDSNEEKDVALTKDPTFNEIIGGYKATGGGIIYTSDVLSKDGYLGSLLYGGELIPIDAFTAAADGKSYTLSGMHSDQSDFTATYSVANKSITIGTDAYTLDEEASAKKASITDFVGYWERSDTHQYWDIQRFNQYYGKEEPKQADFEPIGDYIYLFYEQANNTYYYLLQVHTEGDVKTLVGTYVSPEKAPQQVTFNATEKYEAPVVLTEYATETPITITSNFGTAKTLTVSKIEIGAFDVAQKTPANNLKIHVNIDEKEEVWEFTEIGPGSGKMFNYSIAGTLLSWTATYEKEGSTFKFAFGIKDAKAETIYLYDYNNDDAELGGLTLDGKGVEPTELTFEDYTGIFTIEYSLIPTGKGQMTISKFSISSDYSTVKMAVTVGGKQTELTSESIDDQTDWYNNKMKSDPQAVKQLDLQFKYETSGVAISIVIFADHSLNIIDETPKNIEPLAGHETEKNLFTTSEYESEEDTPEFVTYTGTFTIEYSLIPTGKGQMTISKFSISPDYKTVKITVTVGGKQTELTSESIDDQTDWYNNKMKSDPQAVKQLDLQFKYETSGVAISIVIFADHSLNIIDETPKNIEPLAGHETEKNLFTTSEYKEPCEAEIVTYTGELTLEYQLTSESWTVVEIKFDKNDIQNTLTYKLKGNDKEFKAEWKNPEDVSLDNGPWLGYFAVKDDVTGNPNRYQKICFKYGADSNTLIIASINTTSETLATFNLAA